MSTLHPKSGIDDRLQNWEEHVGPEGRVASVDEDADLLVAQVVGAQYIWPNIPKKKKA